MSFILLVLMAHLLEFLLNAGREMGYRREGPLFPSASTNTGTGTTAGGIRTGPCATVAQYLCSVCSCARARLSKREASTEVSQDSRTVVVRCFLVDVVG